MHHPKSVFSTVFMAITLSSGVALADPPPPEAQRSVYRIEVSISGVEEGPRAAPATYTIILQENQTGTVATGANIPLVASPGPSGSASPRQDVGLSLRLSYTMRGAVVLVAGSVEMSSVGPTAPGTPVTIHRMRADGVAPVTPGTPALFSSVYDLSTRRRYEVTVSAQRLL